MSSNYWDSGMHAVLFVCFAMKWYSIFQYALILYDNFIFDYVVTAARKKEKNRLQYKKSGHSVLFVS